MQINYGFKSWVQLQDDDLPGVVYAGVDDVDGQPRIVQLYIDGRGEPIQAGALRRFPLAALEQVVANMTGDDYHGRHCPTCSAPLKRDERRAKSAGREEAITDWVVLERMARLGKIPQTKMPRDRWASQQPEPIRLSAPENGLTDEFLQDVARAYNAAIEQRLSPATTLAEVAGVNRRTVESWVYKARKRGIMPPAVKKGRIV